MNENLIERIQIACGLEKSWQIFNTYCTWFAVNGLKHTKTLAFNGDAHQLISTVSTGDTLQLIISYCQIFSLQWTLSGWDTSHTSVMTTPHSQYKLAWGNRLLSPQTEVSGKLCFDLSCIIAASIKMFFRNITQAGQRPRDSREALSCSQLCSAYSFDAGRVKLGSKSSQMLVFGVYAPIQITLTYYSEVSVTVSLRCQDVNANRLFACCQKRLFSGKCQRWSILKQIENEMNKLSHLITMKAFGSRLSNLTLCLLIEHPVRCEF